MSITEGLISGFDQARTKYRDAEIAKSKADQDRQFSILQALALHTDPELAKIGAAGLLNLASAGSPKTGKGLSGFLGEVDKSDYMAPLQQIFGGNSPASAVPQPGSAAQPNSAAVDPERVANGPGISDRVTAPTMGGNPGEEQVGARVAAPTFGAQAPTSPLGGTEPPAFGAPGMGGGMPPPGPPPPETPQARSKRLYPSAADIAADTASRTLQARIQAVFEGIRTAKNPDEVDIVRGLAGAPRRRSVTKPLNADYQTADGQQMTGTVIFDPETGQAEVNGEAVTILKMLPTNQPRPIGVNRNVGGVITRDFLDPNDPSAPPIASVPTNMPIPTAPSEYAGTATVNGQVVRLPRNGGAPEVLGDAPQPAGALTPEQQEATGMLTDVNAEAKAALSAYNASRPPGMKATALPVAQQNALVAKITRGQYKTIGELTAATKRQVGTGGSGAAPSRREIGNRVRQRLEKSSPNIVQGPGLPQD
jgi:hypothetical protein